MSAKAQRPNLKSYQKIGHNLIDQWEHPHFNLCLGLKQSDIIGSLGILNFALSQNVGLS